MSSHVTENNSNFIPSPSISNILKMPSPGPQSTTSLPAPPDTLSPPHGKPPWHPNPSPSPQPQAELPLYRDLRQPHGARLHLCAGAAEQRPWTGGGARRSAGLAARWRWRWRVCSVGRSSASWGPMGCEGEDSWGSELVFRIVQGKIMETFTGNLRTIGFL